MENNLISVIKSMGFDGAEFIEQSQISCDCSFRSQCASNACGIYGKCWMCPPDIGEIEDLINEVKSYPRAIWYQTISKLEDSFDFEGMTEAGRRHLTLSHQLDEYLRKNGYKNFLHLSKGGCGFCSPCAKTKGKPCPFPDKALSSLEAYGINVSATTKSTSLKYINGVNTVTYFGIILFRED